ncbi:Pumilio-like 23 isoform B [Glycine soja]|uniref:Pumilio-like 23 isoform B n=1 Tax=Glycine soja TaxID=3848 RepID=A0A445LHE7_GLYSO|nr:Pumilio-like 23 isoform B [Glycine soja]
MVSIGSKTLVSRSSMGEHDYEPLKQGKTKRRKHKKGGSTHAFDSNSFTSPPQLSRVRKQLDPETTQYFSEISNLFESDGVELEDRSLICANALEETKGKEFEIATDYILSHTLETILQGCDVHHLCDFLHTSANHFPYIAMDRSGSHVAETSIKSLAVHLQDDDDVVRPLVEEALTMICKVIAANSVDVMCNCYGSHVLRTLLCLCRGVPLDKSGYYLSKSTTVLADRLNSKEFSSKKYDATNFQPGFPNLLKSLVSDMLKHAKKCIKILQVDQFSSLVFQVVLEVSPEALFNELFTKVFRNSLFELSSHQHGNFVVQALISYASNQDLMELIWEELGPNLEGLFKMGRSGVVASLVAASERLHINEHKCCQVLAEAVCPVDESPKWIVPRLLFLDSCFTSEDKSNWSWQSGSKMHVMGSLILQTVFRFRSECIQPYIISITSMEATHVLEAVVDARGSHVIEAFLCSGASGKQKRRLVTKLQGHFGEVALTSSGAFTIEKCFTASNLSLREAIVSEMLAVRSDLSKAKQGSYLLRKLDIDGYAANPDHWRSKQASKESTYKDFYTMFGSSDTKLTENDAFLADTSNNKSNKKTVKEMRKEIDQSLGSGAPFLSTQNFKKNPKKEKHKSKKNAQVSGDDVNSNRKKKRSNKEKVESGFDIAAKKTLKKRRRDDDLSEASLKKVKAPNAE